MNTWLLVDVHYMCWRAKHTTGGLSHDGVGTGIAFGVIRDVPAIAEMHGASKIIFAFDSDKSKGLRKKILPTYKSSRDEKTDDEKEADKLVYAEIARLKNTILPSMGYRNIFSAIGYEADDIIAAIAQNLPVDTSAVIISADKDLFQCINDRVTCYNPTTQKTMTVLALKQKYGVHPDQWASVKALAGCDTDDVVGVKGVKEKTAADWFNGKLKPTGKKYQKISDNLHLMKQNLPLVKLPYPGLVVPEIVEDEVTDQKVHDTHVSLGFKTNRMSDRAKEKSKQIAKRLVGGFDV